MRERFRKLQQVASLTLGSAPVAVLLFAFAGQKLLPWAWVYPAACGVFCLLGGWIRAKVRLLYGIVVSAALLVFSFLLADNSTWYPLLIADAFYLSLFLWSLTIFGWPPEWELPDILWLICFAAHLIAQFAVAIYSSESRPLLAGYASGLKAAFMAFLVLLAFSMNRSSINSASTKTRHVPVGMRKKNTWMTLVLVALSCLLSFAYNGIKDLLLWLSGILRAEPSETQGRPVLPSQGTLEQMHPVVEEEVSPLLAVWDVIFYILGGLVTTGLLALLIVLLSKRLMKLMKNVWKILERYASAVTEDYEDEIEDTRGESLGEQTGRKKRVPVWRREHVPTHPRENIRYRYRQLLRKHPQWTASTTARENMPEDLAELYEQARYSTHPVTESEAAQFQAGAKELYKNSKS